MRSLEALGHVHLSAPKSRRPKCDIAANATTQQKYPPQPQFHRSATLHTQLTKMTTSQSLASLSASVTSLRSSLSLLDSSISILDSGISDFPRLKKVLSSTRVRLPPHKSPSPSDLPYPQDRASWANNAPIAFRTHALLHPLLRTSKSRIRAGPRDNHSLAAQRAIHREARAETK
jgi:hypothetical protein